MKMTQPEELITGPELLTEMANVHLLGTQEERHILAAASWEQKLRESLRQVDVPPKIIGKLDPDQRRGLGDIALHVLVARLAAEQATPNYSDAKEKLDELALPRIGSIVTAKLTDIGEVSEESPITASHFEMGVLDNQEPLTVVTGRFLGLNSSLLSLTIGQVPEEQVHGSHTSNVVRPFTQHSTDRLVSLAFASKYE